MNQNTFRYSNQQRAANLRQRLLRTSRIINTEIVKGLHLHGFTELRSTHTALLSNLDLDGNSLTLIAQRAGMTKQAMGRLTDELIRLNYIRRAPGKTDKREIILTFTASGLELMDRSFSIMAKIETRCAKRLGENRLNTLLTSLQEIVDEFEHPPT